MNITLNNIGHKFNNDWVFKDISSKITVDNPTVILGNNGSGKSTLLQIISGIIKPSSGILEYSSSLSSEIITQDKLYKTLSISTPITQLPEAYTLKEAISFHRQFKGFLPELKFTEIAQKLQLEKGLDKPIEEYSSGMKQRVKLAFAILSNVECVFLDEPTSNLDREGITWYKNLITEELSKKNKSFIVCSNKQEEEYFFCKNEIDVNLFKK